MKLLPVGLMGTFAIFVIACSPLPSKKTISGTFKLIDSDISRSGRMCSGTGGYSDIQPGLKVIVKNERSKIIGVSELEFDIYKGEHSSVVCEFPFTVENIPKAKFYTIEVGRRGSLTYPYEDLEEQNWEVAFKLG
tara:strand:- start:60 stop:464 length:405 start_codon:yes stop_codon:yes gene_type:complete